MAAKKKELKIEEGEPEPLKVTLKALAEERGISMSTLIQTMKDILSQTAKEILGDAEYIVEFDEEKSEFRIYRKKTVVEKVNNPLTEISLEEARKIDPTAEVGDEAYEVIDTKSMGRRGTQVARNLLMARLSGQLKSQYIRSSQRKKVSL